MSVDEVNQGLESLCRGLLHLDHLLLILHWATELCPEDWANPRKSLLVNFDCLAALLIFSHHEKGDIWRDIGVWGEESLPVGVQNCHLAAD